jgi:hypothetical protein
MMANVHIKSIIVFSLMIAAIIITGNTYSFDLKSNTDNYAYGIASMIPTTNSTTSLDYGIGKNTGSINAVHDFSALNGRSLYNPRINQGSSNYRVGYRIGYNEEWKQLLSAANSSMTTSSSAYKIQHYIVNGNKSLNYTSMGQSLSCTDLNESSPHGAVLAATLNCGNSTVGSHGEGMPTTTSHSLVTPTTAPLLSLTNSCNICGRKGNSIDKSQDISSENQSNSNAQVPSFPPSSPLPGIIPPLSSP